MAVCTARATATSRGRRLAEMDGVGEGELQELGFLGGIAALSFSADERVIYAGVGPRILVYRTLDGTLLTSERVFAHGKIHGFALQELDPDDSLEIVAVFGQKSVSASVARHTVDDGYTCKPAAHFPTMDDWVLNVAFLPRSAEGSEQLLIGFAHNRVEVWCFPATAPGSVPNAVRTHSVLGSVRCFLYSLAFLVEPADPHGVLVASGTVFGSVVLWKVGLPGGAGQGPATATETARLGPHPGVIVRLAFSRDGTSLCSASDDRSVKVWRRGSDGCYTEHHTLEGHRARVWDCVATNSSNGTGTEAVVSCGEDGTCRVWDMQSGHQLVSMEGHLGRLWRVSVAAEHRLIATAGEDSSIKMWPLLGANSQDHREESTRSYTLTDGQSPGHGATCYSDSKSECVKCLIWSYGQPHDSATLLAASAQGKIYCSNSSDTSGTPIRSVWQGSDLSFSAAAAAGVHGLVLGDVRGRAAIVNPMVETPTAVVWEAHEHRILAVWWLPHIPNAVFTASPHGEICMWRLGDMSSQPVLHARMQCEPATATSALAVMVSQTAADEKPRAIFLCGDRKGNCHVFEYPVIDEDDTTGEAAVELTDSGRACALPCTGTTTLKAAFTVRRGGRINNIVIRHDTAYVLARDGYIVRYCVELVGSSVALRLIGKIKAGGGISNIDAITFAKPVALSPSTSDAPETNEDTDEVFISGFHSTDFVLWNSTRHFQLCRIPCGGGRRPYAVTLNPQDPSDYQVAFASEHGSTVQVHARKQNDLCAISPILSLHNSFHGREVNAVELVRLSRSTAQTLAADDPVVMVTGGEDTMLKVTGHDFAGYDGGQGLGIGQHTLHGHPSAIKALCCTHIDGRWPVVISVGAKEAVMAWQLSTNEDTSSSSRQFNSKLVCRWGPRRKSTLDDEEIDHRFHAVTAFPKRSMYLDSDACHIVAAGGTGNAIDLWCFDEALGKIRNEASLVGHGGLVLCLAHCHLQIRSGKIVAYVACGTTSGSVYIWELSGVLNNRLAETSPKFIVAGAHQSGVNCLRMMSAHPNQLTIITGGDDQSILVSTLSVATSPNDETSLAPYSSCRHDLAHASGLKGMGLVHGTSSTMLFSTSLDCRLHVWGLSTGAVASESNSGDNLPLDVHLNKLSSDVLSVADVSALAACRQGTGDNVDVAVVGHGLQAFRWIGSQSRSFD